MDVSRCVLPNLIIKSASNRSFSVFFHAGKKHTSAKLLPRVKVPNKRFPFLSFPPKLHLSKKEKKRREKAVEKAPREEEGEKSRSHRGK